MERYTRFARFYDALSAEPVYRAGRVAGIAGLRLRSGDRVLDVGCGTGLNVALLLDAVGAEGHVVGVDRSRQMLRVARRKAPANRLTLVRMDATELGSVDRAALGSARGFDAVLFTYALSLMPDWPRAWAGATGLLAEGGRAAVVDMRLPTGRARVLAPVARLACRLGGADIHAHPWSALEAEAPDVSARSLRGGHIQVRAGTPRR